jgi:hypothetical protein
MEFETSVDIDAPLPYVVSLFCDPAHFKDWQKGFVSYEPVSGTPRTAGAKARVKYINNGHSIELMETIREMNLPDQMTALYEYQHGVNTMITQFKTLPGNRTQYTTGVGYNKPIGFLPKLMAWLMPGLAKKHNRQWAENFKTFAEERYRQKQRQ